MIVSVDTKMRTQHEHLNTHIRISLLLSIYFLFPLSYHLTLRTIPITFIAMIFRAYEFAPIRCTPDLLIFFFIFVVGVILSTEAADRGTVVATAANSNDCCRNSRNKRNLLQNLCVRVCVAERYPHTEFVCMTIDNWILCFENWWWGN